MTESTITATNFPLLAERYVEMWNETDSAARGRLLEQVCTPDVRYTDPLADAHGVEALGSTIEAVQQQFPGFRFTLQGAVDGHHDQARFSWDLGPSAGDAPIGGFDVVELDDEGRISRVLGFLDRVPTA